MFILTRDNCYRNVPLFLWLLMFQFSCFGVQARQTHFEASYLWLSNQAYLFLQGMSQVYWLNYLNKLYDYNCKTAARCVGGSRKASARNEKKSTKNKEEAKSGTTEGAERWRTRNSCSIRRHKNGKQKISTKKNAKIKTEIGQINNSIFAINLATSMASEN